jgi:hypothetical protein
LRRYILELTARPKWRKVADMSAEVQAMVAEGAYTRSDFSST